MFPILFALLILVSGCADTKPVTPTEVQMITQVFAKRVVAEKLSLEQKRRIVASIEAVTRALEVTPPVDLVGMLKQFFAPEDADIAELIGTLLQERVDLTALPEMDGKAYIWGVLEGIKGGLTL